ncbi:MAG: ABC transporter permease [Gammaproteobacteria bacterium]
MLRSAASPGYLLERLGYIVVILFVVSFVVFAVTQILPGNAAQMILGEQALPEQLAALERRLGLDRPWYAQYASWLGGLLQGDWGNSMVMSRPVLPLVLTALSRSFLLAALALVAVTAIAIPLGVLAAAKRGRPLDFSVSLFSYIGVSFPEFVTATLLLVFLARPEIGLFPAGGYTPPSEGFGKFLSHLVLPAITLTVILMAHISRQTRSEMIDALQQDYVRTATLKGLPRHVVLVRHALRNALLPTITVIALDVGYLIGGIVVVEEVFAYPGLGRSLVFAMQNRDLPLIQAGVLVVAATYAFANLAADLLYGWLDRRIQYK